MPNNEPIRWGDNNTSNEETPNQQDYRYGQPTKKKLTLRYIGTVIFAILVISQFAKGHIIAAIFFIIGLLFISPIGIKFKSPPQTKHSSYTFLMVFLSILLGFSANAISNAVDDNDSGSQDSSPVSQPLETKTDSKKEKSTQSEATTELQTEPQIGKNIDDLDLEFKGNVKNDKTGKWKYAILNDSDIDFTEYAVSYYNKHMNLDETHAIIVKPDSQTIRINSFKSSPDVVYISVLEYVENEELDADLLFSGTVLKDYMVDLKTGKVEDLSNESETESQTESIEEIETTQELTTEEITLPEDKSEIIKTYLELALAENIQNYKISYDPEANLYNIMVWQDGISVGAVLAANGNREEWDNMKNSIASTCSVFQESIAEISPGSHVSINVLNDANTDNTLLTILDGVVVYDSVG